MHRSPFSRRLALFVPALCLASAAAAATVPAIRSDKLSTPVLLDGKTDDWTAIPRVYDAKSGAEFAF